MIQLDLHKAYDMLNWSALRNILTEIGFPSQFVNWIMAGVTTVSYRFNINGDNTKRMEAARGIRQGDPISPFLFVIVMEYFSRLLFKMQQSPEFHHHSKCKKLKVTHLTFAEDILLFTRGDTVSVNSLTSTLQSFSSSTGLIVNPAKCQIYLGAVDEVTSRNILESTGFNRGQLPFKYLGVPLSSKKLSICHYLPLIDKIMCRIHHWSSRLLSIASRFQLVKAVSFAIANYWIQCFPIPKAVIKKINASCRAFVWKEVCKPKRKGGWNVLDLEEWNKIAMVKLLWDLVKKTDSMWVLWIHTYFIKGKDIWTIDKSMQNSWIVNNVLKAREKVDAVPHSWQAAMDTGCFKMSKFYKEILQDNVDMNWNPLFDCNKARPRALLFLWLACHRRLATKERMAKFGFITELQCCFCRSPENIDHLFFSCVAMNDIWANVLKWLNISHSPQSWNLESIWLIRCCKGKGVKDGIFKMVVAETIYHCWKWRNDTCFDKGYNSDKVVHSIKEATIHRGWLYRKYRDHIVKLLM
ncbi:uncharacterized protein LOC131650448 [Vicia villosa]|uniref:uncharacterized protein LOC131650448 n=1 Tax=Vicia villosa TaxID=3911 RepID=UPI00273AF2B5|nr:uncharacterized protein LOC131650448 [Vicia villosa]